MNSVFIALSTLLPIISPIVYTKAILRGHAKPHRTTRFVLLLITSLTTASLFAQHNTVAIWLAGVSTLQSILIFGLSIRYGMGGWTKTDILCLIIAIVGIMLWQTTNQPELGLYASITADFTGMIPALIKTYHHPDTEIVSFYLLDVFAAFFNMLAITVWTLQQFSYPIYIMIINLIMVSLILRKKKLAAITNPQ